MGKKAKLRRRKRLGRLRVGLINDQFVRELRAILNGRMVGHWHQGPSLPAAPTVWGMPVVEEKR